MGYMVSSKASIGGISIPLFKNLVKSIGMTIMRQGQKSSQKILTLSLLK